jgi:DNA-binding transcriptional MerR regulator
MTDRDVDGIGTCGIEDVTLANGRTLTVSEAAAKVGLTAHTLRWYERIGLLDGVPRDSSGHRRYRARDVNWLMLLIRLRATGMPVKEMIRYTELVRVGAGTEHDRQQLLEQHRTRVLAHIADLHADLAVIEMKIDGYVGSQGTRELSAS